jgi:hypothetical protein
MVKPFSPNDVSRTTRRSLLAGWFLVAALPFFGTLRRFVFRIRTQSGSIVTNLLIEAKDPDAAKAKLMKRYPGCTVLDSSEK